MSTRSAIIRKREDGTYEGIYCHFDGYLSNNGVILFKHYQDNEKVKQLIALGDISSLGKNIGEQHAFDIRVKNSVTAYHRDRGEELNISYGKTVEEVENQIGHNGYVYVYDNGWTVNDEDLEEALNSDFESVQALKREALGV